MSTFFLIRAGTESSQFSTLDSRIPRNISYQKRSPLKRGALKHALCVVDELLVRIVYAYAATPLRLVAAMLGLGLYDLLADEGYTVATAPHGEAALTYLHQGPPYPCLILLDLLMPVMNGYDFRRLQQQDAQIAHIPVVVFSAQPLSEREVGGMQLAFYLRKPLALEQLLTIVDGYCR